MTQLAARTRLSKRQIQRLEHESTAVKMVQDRTALSLAKELDVELGVLAGDLPFPKSDEATRPPEAERVQISAWISPEARLAYNLINRRYGVKATTIMNMAPLFFAILAEGSLKWRREKLRELREAIERMDDIGSAAGHLAYAFCTWRASEGAAEEDESIEKADLFGIQVSEEAFEFGYNPSKQNPFADYMGGRNRLHIARSRDRIRCGRPDLNNRYTRQFRDGWWVGTNYSRSDTVRILRDICKAAGLCYGSDINMTDAHGRWQMTLPPICPHS